MIDLAAKAVKTTWSPRNDLVLVEPIEDGDTTSGGIVIPETAQEVPQRGIVKAVGPGRTNEHGVFIPTTLKVGAKIMHMRYAGIEWKVLDDNDKPIKDKEGKDVVWRLIPEGDALVELVEDNK